MKAAVYARVSSDSQDVDLSISAQLRALREYASKHDCEIVREFVDEAESGRTIDRPAFKEMIALARTHQPPFEAVLVWKLNRFARSRSIPSPTKHCSRVKASKLFLLMNRWMTVLPENYCKELSSLSMNSTALIWDKTLNVA